MFCSRSRTIRILPDAAAPPLPSTMPSRKMNKFIDRTLALKNSKENLRTKGWERRPGMCFALIKLATLFIFTFDKSISVC